MKVIDAHTGLEVTPGQKIPLPLPTTFSTPESSKARMRRGLDDYYYVIHRIYPGILKASADVEIVHGGQRRFHSRAPLIVKWTHPGFFLQHVAFVDT